MIPMSTAQNLWRALALTAALAACRQGPAPAPAAPAEARAPAAATHAAAATDTAAPATNTAAAASAAAAQTPRLRPLGSAAALEAYRAATAARRQNASGGLGFGGLGRLAAPPAARPEPAAPSGAGQPRQPLFSEPPGSAGIASLLPSGSGAVRGDRVQLRGDQLTLLQQGWLYQLDLSADSPRQISAIAVDDRTPDQAWYSDLLVDGQTAAVIGYSYADGGTVVHRFVMTAAGQWQRQGKAVLRSRDYFLSHDYRARLQNGKLMLYLPLELFAGLGPSLTPQLPAQRGPEVNAEPGVWRDLLDPAVVIAAAQTTAQPLVHAVVNCDMARPMVPCHASGIIAPEARMAFAGDKALYLWMAGEPADLALDSTRGEASGWCYRLPWDGKAPTAARVFGLPASATAFVELQGGTSEWLVQRETADPGQWHAGWPGHLALARLQLPAAAFSDCAESAAPKAYQPLPNPGQAPLQVQFAGPWLAYANAAEWFGARKPHTQALQLVQRSDGQLRSLQLGHGVEYLAAAGSLLVALGAKASDLQVSAIDLSGQSPRLDGQYSLAGRSDAEVSDIALPLAIHSLDSSPSVIGLALTRHEAADRRGQGVQRGEFYLLGWQKAALTQLGALTAPPAPQLDAARLLLALPRVWALADDRLQAARLAANGLTPTGQLTLTPEATAPRSTKRAK
jgi:hypothetical protein